MRRTVKQDDPPRCVVVGRKPPPGYREVQSMHMGNGMWLISCVKVDNDGRPAPKRRKAKGGKRV